MKDRLHSLSGAVMQYAHSRGLSDLESVCAQLRKDCYELVREQVQPPIFLYAPSIVEQQHIDSIRKVNMVIDGRVYPYGDTHFRIEVNSKSFLYRQNFTLGHEIGHTFFLPYELRERNRRQDKVVGIYSNDDVEEYLCDLASSELLMPGQIFQQYTVDWGPSAFSILRLCRFFQCSEVAVARRFAEIGVWRVIIGRWRLQDSGKHLRSEWSYTSPDLGLFLPKGQLVDSNSILGEVWRTSVPKYADLDLGFTSLGYVPLEEKFFTHAFAYGSSDNRRLLTVTILEKNPESLAHRFMSQQNSSLFSKRFKTKQLELPFQ